jgi:anti-sigma regulatory factor (Ser/Thr protein kinase)
MSESPVPERMTLTLPSTADSVPVVRHALRGMLEAAGVDGQATADVLLAVTEACTNAVLHARAGEGSDGLEMQVEAGWQEGGLEVVVRDHGQGFTPRVDSPGLGLGLPVIAALSHRMELRETPGGGTEVVMDFQFPAAAATRGAG